MLSTWDYVRPNYWHPMSSMEQTMMDLDLLDESMNFRQSTFPFTFGRVRRSQNSMDEDEFFEDFIMEDDESDDQNEETNTNQSLEAMNEEEKLQHERDRNAYQSYSYTTSSALDKNGKRVVNTRRRYEDSNGRLKAIHDREVDGKKLKTIWHRKNKNDQGEHKSICSSGTVDEFEQLWADTPFGKAKAKHEQSLQNEQPPALENTKTDSTENTNTEAMHTEQ